MNNEELLAKYKALFPDNVEAIVVRKDDYDRLYGDLTLENIELKQEIERLNNSINELEKSIQKEIERTESLIRDDYEHCLGGFGNIRKIINEDRKKWLYKIKQLKGSDKE